MNQYLDYQPKPKGWDWWEWVVVALLVSIGILAMISCTSNDALSSRDKLVYAAWANGYANGFLAGKETGTETMYHSTFKRDSIEFMKFLK